MVTADSRNDRLRATPTVLGIETSCDETAVAIVTAERQVMAERIRSQIGEHAAYGGVVPEIAARAHVLVLDRLIADCLEQARITFGELDGVAVTAGPGLIGGLLVGTVTADAIATVHGLPVIAVNHLEGHALTARLTDDLGFPYLLLLASGGHCQLLVVEGVGRYRRLGTTIDDALGEAFDKTAKLLGLGYPGGPAVEAWARRGDPGRFALPRPLKGQPGCHFSFSGLKTAVAQAAAGMPERSESRVADLCASFQAAACEAVVDRTRNAIALIAERSPAVRTLVIAGGVAANQSLRAALGDLAESRSLDLVAPPLRWCTDNGAMIAWAGIERLRLNLVEPRPIRARPRWPLDPTAEPAIGAGVKG